LFSFADITDFERLIEVIRSYYWLFWTRQQ